MPEEVGLPGRRKCFRPEPYAVRGKAETAEMIMEAARNNIDLFNLLEILLDGSRPAGKIRSRAIGYTKERWLGWIKLSS